MYLILQILAFLLIAALIGFATVHILAVAVTELREGGNLISAMFSGKKVLSRPPADLMKAD